MIVHDDELVTLHLGDCVAVMAELPADSVDAIVTDPPYLLQFMGKSWDGKSQMSGHATPDADTVGFYQAIGKGGRHDGGLDNWKPHWMQEWHTRWAREAMRVAKPGAHLLAAGGTRTVHRLASAIEDAGWEIRDMLIWGYASGFPKSRQISPDLLAAVPEDARCACEPRSTRTALGSQDGYRPERGSDGGLPHQDEGDGLAPAPLPAGARGRSRGGQRGDGPAEGSGHTLGLEAIVRPSIEDLPGLTSPWSVDSQSGGSTQSGTPASTSSASPKGPRRTGGSRSNTPDSGVAAAASSWQPSGDTSWYSKCTSCEGWKVAPGLGTALKPSFEPWVMARKPLRGTVAGNVQEYGTGALNIDATRIGMGDEVASVPQSNPANRNGEVGQAHTYSRISAEDMHARQAAAVERQQSLGRWPANLLLTDAIFDGDTPGVVGGGEPHGAGFAQIGGADTHPDDQGMFGLGGHETNGTRFGDSGTYSRFFQIPRGEGCYLCGRARDAAPTSDPVSPPAASAVSDAPTSPAGMVEPSTGLEFPTGPSSTTNGTEQTSWHGDGVSTPSIPRSRRRGTSPASVPPSSPAKSPDAGSQEIGTTTTMPDRWTCDTCAALTTSAITFEPGNTRMLLIPKSSRSDREPLVRGVLEEREQHAKYGSIQEWSSNPPRANVHPTVKPLDLMRHLVRLVTPPGGTVLDCFLGSGTTAIAANSEGFRCIGIEREREYLEIALARMAHQPLGMQL